VDANSRPFTQIATVTNLSENGVSLDGVRIPLKPGCVVDVQYNGTKAEFVVVWAGQPGRRNQGELGLEALPAQPYIWDACFERTCEMVAQG
jgi:hypothetical protein